jgi:sugar lactone lactonase YvrE
MRVLDAEAAEFFTACDELGEGPAWHPAKGVLLWVDIIRGRLYSHDIGAGITSVCEYGRPVSAALPRVAGGTVVAVDDGLLLLDAGGEVERHIPVEADIVTNRLGDMGVDPAGRLWLGTLDKDLTAGRGGLYRLSPAGDPVKVIDQTCIANGIGWSPDGSLMYFVDSAVGRIDVLDYDVRDGSATGRRPWASVDHVDGSPDGLAVDSLGGVWVAIWGGGQVRRYSPDGELDAVLPLPVRNVSSCCFAGPELDQLFITTARVEMTERMLRAEPLAGSVFCASTGFRGLSMPAYAG